jgi:crossover junction endonuclease MUS81
MKIVVDDREHSLIKLLKALNNDYEYNIPIVVEKMDLGDIAIHFDDEEIILMERKKLSDLASSIRDGRYKEQSYRLNGNSLHNHNIMYIIEGNICRYNGKFSKVKPETLYVSMFCLQYFKGFSVFRTMDVTETAEYILRITNKLRREKEKYGFYHSKFVEKPKSYTNVVKKVKKDNITPDNIGAILLSQIPGVSSKTAEIIINKYQTILNLLQCLEKNNNCLNDLTYKTSKGQDRRISQTAIKNIIQYLLCKKSSVIKIDI